MTDCLVCEYNTRLSDLPPREDIAHDRYWRVAHAFGTGVEGWLILTPLRHVTAIADLTEDEAAAMGTWQWRLSRALHCVFGCAKTYVAQFAEAEGFGHVHFHVVPRMADLTPELKGPRVFALLGRPEEEDVGPRRRDEVALEIRRFL